MIGFLEGTVKASRAGYCVLMIGGVGYKLYATKEFLAKASEGAQIGAWTHLAIREDSHDLYGFSNEQELRFFEMLLTVSGIGPKSALAILDIASVATLGSAISQGNAGYLTKVSGIGKKTAEKIILELRDKVGLAADDSSHALSGDEDALEAMKSLGYSHAEARDALRKVPASVHKSNDRLREALKILGSR